MSVRPLERTWTSAPLANYPEQGFAVLPGIVTPDELESLRAESVAVCRGDRGTVVEVVGGNKELASVRTAPVEVLADLADEDVLRRFLCIHYPHKISELFRQAQANPLLVRALTQVIGPDVKAIQSMLFIKSEGKPGQAWHQDEYWIPTRDRSLTGAWLALDDATIENGCLWVLPGSHRSGVIHPTRDPLSPDFDCSEEAYDFPYADGEAVPVEVAAGSLVLFNGYLLHRSLPNAAERGLRRALVNHYMSATSTLPWRPPAEGRHMATADFRDITLVAGTDPYAWKGLADLSRPYVRPDGKGGCDR